jgi:chromosomal replication initiator protein
VTTALDHAWPRIADALRSRVTDSTYAIWLEPLRPVHLSGDVLTVAAPDELRSWVTQRYAPLLTATVREVLGGNARVDIVEPGAPPRAQPTAAAPPSAPTADEATYNPRLTFDQFVIGDSNRLAHAAALAVAEMPSQAYNPLYICGPPGLGKTHLLHAIANYVEQFGNGLTVRYTTVEAFTNEFVSALHRKAIDAFKSRFRGNDVLLIDDVQFLATKARTEEEFFHTFNALYDMGAQLVLTSDRPPRDLDALEDRLRDRFASGLVCEVKPPDLATRMTILAKRAHHDGVVLEAPAAQLIAERVTDNVRALEGALVRVVAFASLTSRPVGVDVAAEVLAGLYRPGRAVRRSVDDVVAAVAEVLEVSREDLLSTSRSPRVTWPRQIAMYLARELTDQTLPAIGRAFGGRDHTTVMYACKRTAERIKADEHAYEVVRDLTERLRGHG